MKIKKDLGHPSFEDQLALIEHLHELVIRFRVLQSLRDQDIKDQNPLIREELLELYLRISERV